MPPWAILIVAISMKGLFAQEQPLDTEKLPNAEAVARPDPLREAALPEELIETSDEPLPATDETDRSAWRERLTPVFASIEEIPVSTIEAGAYKYRRARIRLTEKDRAAERQPFRLMRDREEHPDLYWGKPVAVHGYLSEIREVSPPEENQDAEVWFEGRLKIWKEEGSVRFVSRRLPEGVTAGKEREVPVSVIGYVFPLANAESQAPEPLIAAAAVRPFRPVPDASALPPDKGLTIGISGDDEWDAYYRLLLHARLVDNQTQQRLAAEFWKNRQTELEKPRPLFVDLFKSLDAQPEIYRGQPVTLTGTLRTLTSWDESDRLNDYGIERVYEGWIFTPDSQSNPTVVVFTENPDDLPVRENLNLPVKVTGYVFKMYGYRSHENLRKAPMIMAAKMERMNVPEPEPFPTIWVGGVVGLLILGVVLFLWSNHQKDKEFRQKTRAKDQADEPPQFDNLDPE